MSEMDSPLLDHSLMLAIKIEGAPELGANGNLMIKFVQSHSIEANTGATGSIHCF